MGIGKFCKVCLSSAAVTLLISGCGGSSSSSSNADSKNNVEVEEKHYGKGHYIDAPVEGLGYKCGEKSGTTDSVGGFEYEIGKGCEFSVGALKIREVSEDKLKQESVTIQETDLKISQFLLSLNISQSPEKIKIDPNMVKKLSQESFRGSIESENLSEIIEKLDNSIELISEEEAREHIEDSFERFKGTKGLLILGDGLKEPQEDKQKETLKPEAEQEKNPPEQNKEKRDDSSIEEVDNKKEPTARDSIDKKDSKSEPEESTPKKSGDYSSQAEERSQKKPKPSNAVASTEKPTKTKDEDKTQNQQNSKVDKEEADNQKGDIQSKGNATDNQKEADSQKENSSPTEDSSQKKESRGDSSKGADYDYGSSDNNSEASDKKDSINNKYSYIPKGDALTDEMAIRFLSMTTFGHTPELIQELREKGVVKWVEEQLNMPYNEEEESVFRRTVEMSYTAMDFELNDELMQKILADEPAYAFNRHGGNFNASGTMGFWVEQALLNIMLTTKSQLRHRVAYALHQWVVASQSLDGFFARRMDALAYYYDLLIKNAFGKYQDLLYDVSVSPAMGTFLTYLNNQKLHKVGENTIYPDENYGREIMQLFTIGLYKLDMDGTVQISNEQPIYNFSEDDVKEMSRVFTGLMLNTRFPKDISWGKSVHSPMRCKQSWHDSEEKRVMGEILAGGQDCYGDVRNAVEMLTKHPSFYPYIAKKLIMRLTESNPSIYYVFRVATVFKESGNSLKEAVRAVLLDSELWNNITNGKTTKLKEPFLAYMQMLRALEAKPKRWTKFGKTSKVDLENTYFFPDPRRYIFQAPLYSPTVFNYYSDDFIPNDDEFKSEGFVAPEFEIQTVQYQTGYSKFIYQHFTSWNTINHEYNFIKQVLEDKNEENKNPYEYSGVEGGSVKNDPKTNVIFDMSFAYDAVREAIGGDLTTLPSWNASNRAKMWQPAVEALCDAISKRLTGKEMPKEVKEAVVEEIVNNPNSRFAWKGRDHLKSVYIYWIVPITEIVLSSPEYLTQ